MSGGGLNYNNPFLPHWSKKIPAIFATVLIFTVAGFFLFLLINEIPDAWENCSISFPTDELPHLLQLTLTTAIQNAAIGFRDFFFIEPTFKIAAAVCIWNGLRSGKHLVLSPLIAWLLVSAPLILLLTQDSVEGEFGLISNLYTLSVGLLVTTFCGYLAKQFW